MRKDNRGVSLVEIMTVVAIFALLGGIGIWGINAMTGKPAQQCAQKIVYSLERHRTTAMSKARARYELFESGGKVYLKEYVSDDPVEGNPMTPTSEAEIGSSRVKVRYRLSTDLDPDDPSTLHDLSVDGPLKLEFDRKTGAFKTQDPAIGGGYCTQIIVSSGGRDHQVTLVPLTGKVYIN